MVTKREDLALFHIEQDLMDLEEDLVKVRGGPTDASDRILIIADKVKDLQNG